MIWFMLKAAHEPMRRKKQGLCRSAAGKLAFFHKEMQSLREGELMREKGEAGSVDNELDK
jgi:hypothetical protein